MGQDGNINLQKKYNITYSDILFTGKVFNRIYPQQFIKVIRPDFTGSMGFQIKLGKNECEHIPYAGIISNTDIAKNGFYFSDQENIWDDLYEDKSELNCHVCFLNIPDDALVSSFDNVLDNLENGITGLTSAASNKIFIDKIMTMKEYKNVN